MPLEEGFKVLHTCPLPAFSLSSLRSPFSMSVYLFVVWHVCACVCVLLVDEV